MLATSCCRDSPSNRLGYKSDGWGEVRQHPWFDDIDWYELRQGVIIPDYVPEVSLAYTSEKLTNHKEMVYTASLYPGAD